MGLEVGAKSTSASAPLGGGLTLSKGEKLDLTKGNPGLSKILVGLGWDVNASGGEQYDLDAEAFLLDDSKHLISKNHVIYFNNKKSPDGAIVHHGDNLTGQGEGDDEVISVELSQVSQDVQRIVFGVTIFQAKSRRQNFGQVNNAFIRIVDEATGNEICRYDLTEDYSASVSVIVAEVYRHNGEWKFGALGNGSDKDLSGLSQEYGL